MPEKAQGARPSVRRLIARSRCDAALDRREPASERRRDIAAAHRALLDDPELTAASAMRAIAAGSSAAFAWRAAIAAHAAIAARDRRRAASPSGSPICAISSARSSLRSLARRAAHADAAARRDPDRRRTAALAVHRARSGAGRRHLQRARRSDLACGDHRRRCRDADARRGRRSGARHRRWHARDSRRGPRLRSRRRRAPSGARRARQRD